MMNNGCWTLRLREPLVLEALRNLQFLTDPLEVFI